MCLWSECLSRLTTTAQTRTRQSGGRRLCLTLAALFPFRPVSSPCPCPGPSTLGGRLKVRIRCGVTFICVVCLPNGPGWIWTD